MSKVYTGYHATRQMEHGSPACTFDNLLGGQTLFYFSFNVKNAWLPNEKNIYGMFIAVKRRVKQRKQQMRGRKTILMDKSSAWSNFVWLCFKHIHG